MDHLICYSDFSNKKLFFFSCIAECIACDIFFNLDFFLFHFFAGMHSFVLSVKILLSLKCSIKISIIKNWFSM